MRVEIINLQIVKNLGNYETLRLGAEWTPDNGQTLSDAMAQGMAELQAAADEIINGKKQEKKNPVQEALEKGDAQQAAKEPDKAPTQGAEQEQEQDTREMIAFDSPKLQKILKRIEAGIDRATVDKYYRFTDDAQRVIDAAYKLNKQ